MLCCRFLLSGCISFYGTEQECQGFIETLPSFGRDNTVMEPAPWFGKHGEKRGEQIPNVDPDYQHTGSLYE